MKILSICVAVIISSITVAPTMIFLFFIMDGFKIDNEVIPIMVFFGIPVAITITTLIGLPIHFLLQWKNYNNKTAYGLSGFLITAVGLVIINFSDINLESLFGIAGIGTVGAIVAITFRDIWGRFKCNAIK